MSKYKHFAIEIKAEEPNIGNAELGRKVKARIAAENLQQSPHDIHGLPDPMNTDASISDRTREKAKEIINVSAENQKSLMIQYVRQTFPKVSKIVLDVNSGSVKKKTTRAEPIGALVAFLLDDGKLLVGWSKYNLKEDDDGVRIEKLVFTKKDAIHTAVLRALTDTIDRNAVPFKVRPDLDAFISRAERYFGRKAANITTTFGFA